MSFPCILSRRETEGQSIAPLFLRSTVFREMPACQTCEIQPVVGLSSKIVLIACERNVGGKCGN